MNTHSGKCRTVYMLLPSEVPICENNYDGYGVFGGIDAYEWLAKMNAPQSLINRLSKEKIRSLGIFLAGSDFFIDTTGKRWACKMHCDFGLKSINLFTHYEAIIPEFGVSANAMIKTGAFHRVPARELLLDGLEFPLKFSFNRDAKYEDLPEAEECPLQGFYENED